MSVHEVKHMGEQDILFSKLGSIAHITINRAEALNALNHSVLTKLDRVLDDIEEDPAIVAAVITGAGSKAFIAGADVKEIKEAGPGRTAFITGGQQTIYKIKKSSKVMIAAINGYALGGGLEVALMCDFRIASEKAKLGLPEAGLGVMAGYGGTQMLPRLIGPGRAKYMILTGAILSAREAHEIGLVDKVCPPEELNNEVTAITEKIAASGPLSIKGSKEAIDRGLALPLEEALKLELSIYDKVANSEDAEDGLSAFLEKRRPVFRGK